jgi:hypothetical protein
LLDRNPLNSGAPDSPEPAASGALQVPPPEVLAPDNKPYGAGRYIGVLPDGTPVPRKKKEDCRPSRTDEYRAQRLERTRYRTRQRKAGRRPGWWSPDGVMAKLREGLPVYAIIDEARKDAGNRISLSSLHADVRGWRKALPAFDRDYKEMLALVPNGVLPEEVWDAFFEAMAEFEGKVEHACAALGLGVGPVYAMLDSRNGKTYNKRFAERFRIAEAPRMGVIRTKYLRHAENGDGDKTVQQAILEVAMPAMHGRKKTIAVEGGIDLRLERQSMEQAVARERALFAGREEKQLPAVPEPITIDVAALAVKESVG